MPIFPHPTPSYSPTENDHCSAGGPRAGWAVCAKVTEGGEKKQHKMAIPPAHDSTDVGVRLSTVGSV